MDRNEQDCASLDMRACNNLNKMYILVRSCPLIDCCTVFPTGPSSLINSYETYWYQYWSMMTMLREIYVTTKQKTKKKKKRIR